MNPNVSIIIRAKNEEKYLGQVLEALTKQSYRDFEVVLVDDNSTDKTPDIARDHGCKIITIPEGKFTYPFACNLGIKHSVGRYIVFLSGHSIPIGQDWLYHGLANFNDENVAGIYSTVFALPDANLLERFLYGVNIFRRRKFAVKKVRQVKMGVLGFTNAMIRRDLWEKHNIDENFAGGSEDRAWAKHWVDKGFTIIHEPRFVVYHSHNLGPIDELKQFMNWVRQNDRPMSFKAQKRNFEPRQAPIRENRLAFPHYLNKIKTILVTDLFGKKTAELDLLMIHDHDKERDF